MAILQKVQFLVLLLYIASFKCNAEQLDVADFGKVEFIADQALKENLRSKQEDGKTNTQQDSNATNSDLDTDVFLKPKPNLDVSEEVIKQAIAEARAEVEQENQQNKAEDTSQRSRHVTYQGMHYRARPNPEVELQGDQAKMLERTVKKIADEYGLSSADAIKQLTGLQSDYIKRSICKTTVRRVRCNPYRRYRSITGVCNNFLNPRSGAANTPFKRLLFPAYADGLSKPRTSREGGLLPNARFLSRRIFTDKNRLSSSFTHLLMTWGQYMDHDMTLGQQPTALNCPSGNTPCSNKGECFGIEVLADDPDFRGTQCIRVKRDVPAPRPNCGLGAREQVNTLTAFIDASQVYGSSKKRLEEVRDPNPCCGLLRVTKQSPNVKPLLPSAPREEFCTTTDKENRPCFRAGDGRVNENQGLATIHTLWVREHNRIAKELKKINRRWSGIRIFMEARKIVGAMLQHITFNEFLPIVLNSETRNRFHLNLLKKRFYYGYSLLTNPSISNSFAAAAFRFGHSLIRNDFGRFGKKSTRLPSIATKNFENPEFLYDRSRGGVDAILRGLVKDQAQTFDRHFVKAITAKLIVAPKVIIDLPAVNIQRGREHGVPGYNHFRSLCGLKKASRFQDLEQEFSNTNRQLLEKYYKHVDDIDLFVGGVLERPMREALVGPTFSCIIGRQFQDLRRGDRFWYERFNRYTGFSRRQLTELRKVSLARVICDNADDITHIQPNVMQLAGPNNPIKECSKIPQLDLSKWRARAYY